MSYSNALMTGLLRSGSLGSTTTSGTTESQRVVTPSGLTDALLQRYALSGRVGLAEKWIPVGIWYVIATTTTVNVGVVTLYKNGVAAATGGKANIVVAAAATTELFSPFTDYTFAAAWAAGDLWSIATSTTQGAGVINPVYLAYVNAAQVGLSDGVAE
ncbi:MAG TPA: hypothetical protein VN903_16535 [Polyangia bacterium]|nr:hypothetical protein [Polyangia bacterium]